MTPTEVYEFMDECFPGAVRSDAYGVSWGPLRIERGSGIAGRGGVWAITAPGHPTFTPVTGIATRGHLKRAIRTLILELAELGDAFRKVANAGA